MDNTAKTQIRYSRGAGEGTNCGTFYPTPEMLAVWGINLDKDGNLVGNKTMTAARDGNQIWICPGPSKAKVQNRTPHGSYPLQITDRPDLTLERTAVTELDCYFRGDILVVIMDKDKMTEPVRRVPKDKQTGPRTPEDVIKELTEVLDGKQLKVLIPGHGFHVINPNSIQVL